MATFKALTLVVMVGVFYQLTLPSDGSKSLCRKITAISCRVVTKAGGAAGGAAIGTLAQPGAGTIAGAAVGAGVGQLASEVCDPVSSWVCGKRRKRRRTMVDPAELEEFDKQNQIILFPQSFANYQSKDGKISLDHFIERVGDALPGHLHGLANIAENFMEADTNDDGFLDKDEFSKGSWIAQADDDVSELKRAIMMHGMEF